MHGEPKDAPDSPSDRPHREGVPDRRYPRQRRLVGPSLFDRVFKIGRRKTGQYFSVHWVDAGDQKGRLGLVVAKRLTRTGVARNKVKRLVRESYRYSAAMGRALHVVVRLRAMYPEGARMAARLELRTLLEGVR